MAEACVFSVVHWFFSSEEYFGVYLFFQICEVPCVFFPRLSQWECFLMGVALLESACILLSTDPELALRGWARGESPSSCFVLLVGGKGVCYCSLRLSCWASPLSMACSGRAGGIENQQPLEQTPEHHLFFLTQDNCPAVNKPLSILVPSFFFPAGLVTLPAADAQGCSWWGLV